jgi:hypothetical protein
MKEKEKIKDKNKGEAMKIIECGTEESLETIENEKIADHLNMHHCEMLMKELYQR